MIEISNIDIHGWTSAIRGMRNPMNSWDKSDTGIYWDGDDYDVSIGDNDLDLMKRLVKAGTDHRKFMRMLICYVDLTCPLYFWKEFDTYKVGTVRNSCSTMHKITAKEFTLDDFSHEHLIDDSVEVLKETIEMLNKCRRFYLETKDKKYWCQMIQLLPSSYNQRATVMLNYEVLANMYHGRKNHKLDEWREFCKWVETLPYFAEIVGLKGDID